MIEPVPHRWRSIQASVGDSIEVPTDAESVSLLPAEDGSNEVTVSFFMFDFMDKFDRVPEVESRPIESETIAREETSRTVFRYHSTIVPASDGKSATVYYLGQTEEERRLL